MATNSYQPPYNLTPAMFRMVEEIGEALGQLQAESYSVEPHLRRGNRIRTIQASCAIEGNTLSIEQITALLGGKRVLSTPHEIREVRNAFAAYERMVEWSPHSREDLLAAHGVLMAGLVDRPGHFRSGSVGIQRGEQIVHVAPPADRVPALISDLLAWLKVTPEHPLIASCVFHYEFEFIHPFQDGNGRMGRLWQTLILSRWNPLFAAVSVETLTGEHQADYYAALNASNKAVACTPFIEFMLAMIRDALQELIVTEQVREQLTEQVTRLLSVMGRTPLYAREIMLKLGLTHRPNFLYSYLQPALADGLIEMTRPDAPRARNQKYRLTPTGRRLADKENIGHS